MDTKKLRQKILDLAIHGKLVPQDPNDEPASVLLERIRKEKEQLIKEGKIKAPKKSKTAGDTSHYPKDVPFAVPEGWVWTEIAEISSSINYGVSESAKVTGKYRLLRITDIQDGKVSWESVPFTDYPEDKAKAFELSDGDILFARTGATVGKSYLVESAQNNAIFASYLIRVQYSHSVIPQYIKFFFESGYYWEQISSNSVGVGQPNVNGTSLGKLRIPLPPAAEQKRISEEAHRWMGVIDSLEFEAQHLSEDIGASKSKILDLAIHGKLVPQDPSDEPAIELLKRINPAFQPSYNLHYEDCPAGWLIVPFKEIISLYSGRDIEASRCNSEQRGFPYLVGASCIEGQNISIYRWTEYPEVISQVDDVLLSCKGTVGEVILNTLGDVHIARQFMAIRSKSSQLLLPRYVELIVKASVERLKNTARGIIPGISREDILEMDVAIPPLTEQKRILSRINEIEHSLSHISLYVCD